MNNARMRATIAGLTNIARKVLDSTPIQDRWDYNQIANELYRLGRSHIDTHTI